MLYHFGRFLLAISDRLIRVAYRIILRGATRQQTITFLRDRLAPSGLTVMTPEEWEIERASYIAAGSLPGEKN